MAYPGLVILLVAAFVVCAHSNTTFTSPGPFKSSQDASQYPTYKVGQRIDVQWESSNATGFDLYLAMSYPSYYALQLTNQSKSQDFEWTVSLDDIKTSISESDVYVLGFGLYTWDSAGEKNPEPILSAFFNVSAPDTGLSTGAVAGIAVGSTIGGLLVIGGLAFLAWRSFRGLKGFRDWKDSQHVEAGQAVSQSQPESLPPQYHPINTPHGQPTQHSPAAFLGYILRLNIFHNANKKYTKRHSQVGKFKDANANGRSRYVMNYEMSEVELYSAMCAVIQNKE